MWWSSCGYAVLDVNDIARRKVVVGSEHFDNPHLRDEIRLLENNGGGAGIADDLTARRRPMDRQDLDVEIARRKFSG